MLFQEILQFVSDLSEPKIFVVNVIRLVIKLIRRAFRHKIKYLSDKFSRLLCDESQFSDCFCIPGLFNNGAAPNARFVQFRVKVVAPLIRVHIHFERTALTERFPVVV